MNRRISAPIPEAIAQLQRLSVDDLMKHAVPLTPIRVEEALTRLADDETVIFSEHSATLDIGGKVPVR